MMRSIFQASNRLKELQNFNKQGKYTDVIMVYKDNLSGQSTLLEKKEYYHALKKLGLSNLTSERQANENAILAISKVEKPSNQFILNLIDKLKIRFFDFLFIGLVLYFFKDNLFKNTSGETNEFKFVKVSNVRFSDVRGIDEYKQEIEDIVDYLKNPKVYLDSGVKITKGVLLTGKPGTGKTLLAKAIAGEAGVTFYQTSGSSFEEKYVGLGPKRIRTLFEEAKKNAPCIIFIDEIDSVAQSRNYRSANYSKDSLNQLLVEMDGFATTEQIIVIGATNFPESIDKALLRSGRFDKIVDLPVPDRRGRLDILNYYLSKIQTDTSIDLETLVGKTQGMTGAELENLVNLAALNAVRSGQEKCSWSNFDSAIDRITIGLTSKTMNLSEDDINCTVYHELGHAIVAFFTKGAGELNKITILPRGPSLGHTAILSNKENKAQTREEILAHIDVCMGGRAAEELFFGLDCISSGCSSDLKSATQYAYYGVTSGVFSDITGLQSFQDVENMGNDQRNKVDQWVLNILSESYNRAKVVIQQKINLVHQLAKELKEKETLTREQFTAIANNS